jgi:hypothetical protein
MDSYKHIRVERHDDVFCVRLRHTRLEETEIHQLGGELTDLCEQQGCRKLALSLGPEPPDCLYSVFLAKLVSVRNALRRNDGELILCEVSPTAFQVFEACLLHREFTFVPDFTSARAAFLQRQSTTDHTDNTD